MRYPVHQACAAAIALASNLALAQDLSSLPEYRPARQVSGILRSRGSDQMATLMQSWERGFRRRHPNVSFEDTFKGNASAMIGLEESVADMVLMSRKIVPYDTYGVWRRSHKLPIEIVVGTGSFDVPQKAAALTVFVHRDNPLSRLTLRQLDGIFGGQRTGGWQGMDWSTEVARSEKDDIRTWGQLGLTGEWANQPIHPYGPPGLYPGGMSFFQIRVLGGADTWAEALQEFEDPKQMMQALGMDRYAIAYTGMSYKTPQVKPVALAQTRAGPYVESTRENVRNGTYPLARSIYIYLPPDAPNGDLLQPRIDPKVKEFLRYVLSQQGQQDIVRDGGFLPLTSEVVGAELKKLDQEDD